jgi:predicted metalloprotease
MIRQKMPGNFRVRTRLTLAAVAAEGGNREKAMRWDDFRRSENVEDVRGEGGGHGGGFGIPIGGGGLSIGTILVLGIVGYALGIDPRILIGGAEILSGGSQYEEQAGPAPARTGAPSDEAGQFVAAVLGSTEDTWTEIFRAGGQTYQPARLRIFAGATQGCGSTAQASMGPFYCPVPQERRIYLDTSFFRDIEQRFRGCSGKACQFAQAYVIAHEVGHHVQNQLGILDRAQARQQAAGSRAEANQIQVRVELQADCFAGIWANNAEKKHTFIEPGDVDAALQTASAIGDDTLQRRSQGRVVPDSFTHGSAEQRKRWFMTGFQKGTVAACDTFSVARP